MLKRSVLAIALLGFSLIALSTVFAQDTATETPGETEVTNAVQSGYASVNGMEMYYEIHGTGAPLVVLHGAYMNIDAMGGIIPRLAETRQVIAVELQGHGRTNDVEGRPFTYEQFADDVAAFMDVIGVEQADVFGFSMGASTAIQFALRHPERVNKLIVVSGTYNSSGATPDLLPMLQSMTPEMFIGTPIEAEYRRLAPNPDGFATLVQKLIDLDVTPQDWSPEAIQALTSPTLVIVGDSDSVQPEHAVSLFRLRGGGVNGDMAGLPSAQLAILPGTTHLSVLGQVDLLTAITTNFLDGVVIQPAF